MIKKHNIEKLILISIMILLIGLPIIMIFVYTCQQLGLYNLGRINRVYLLWYGIPVLFILHIVDLVCNKKKIVFVDILVYLLILLGAISTIFAVDMKVSIYGAITRDEGLLSLLSYYLILLNIKNMSNEKYKSILVKTFIVLGIVQMVYSILQVYTNFDFILRWNVPYVACGLSGNPNFFGSYMVILASFVFSMYMLERKRVYFILSVIFFIGVCFSYSTGPLISFLLVVIFFIIYYRKKIKWQDVLKILLVFVLSYFLVDFSLKIVHNNILKNEISPSSNISSVVKDLSLSNFGNGRVKLWKESLPLLKEYWSVGAGLDNFGRVYGVRDGLYYDKAHNVYLQIAITNGIFALIIYLGLMAVIFFKGLKIKEPLYIALFMAFIGYSIQAFANISVIEVAPNFFAICGLLLGKIQHVEIEKA